MLLKTVNSANFRKHFRKPKLPLILDNPQGVGKKGKQRQRTGGRKSEGIGKRGMEEGKEDKAMGREKEGNRGRLEESGMGRGGERRKGGGGKGKGRQKYRERMRREFTALI